MPVVIALQQSRRGTQFLDEVPEVDGLSHLAIDATSDLGGERVDEIVSGVAQQADLE